MTIAWLNSSLLQAHETSWSVRSPSYFVLWIKYPFCELIAQKPRPSHPKTLGIPLYHLLFVSLVFHLLLERHPFCSMQVMTGRFTFRPRCRIVRMPTIMTKTRRGLFLRTETCNRELPITQPKFPDWRLQLEAGNSSRATPRRWIY
jgi:hypothetical protein